MSDARESLFHCRFESHDAKREALVRAWDAREALDLFVVELRTESVDEPGRVVVAERGAPRSLAQAYRPSRSGASRGRRR